MVFNEGKGENIQNSGSYFSFLYGNRLQSLWLFVFIQSFIKSSRGLQVSNSEGFLSAGGIFSTFGAFFPQRGTFFTIGALFSQLGADFPQVEGRFSTFIRGRFFHKWGDFSKKGLFFHKLGALFSQNGRAYLPLFQKWKKRPLWKKRPRQKERPQMVICSVHAISTGG